MEDFDFDEQDLEWLDQEEARLKMYADGDEYYREPIVETDDIIDDEEVPW